MRAGLAAGTLVASVALGSCTLRQGSWAPWSRVDRGSRLFLDKGCHGCHTLRRLGTPIGPDLTHVGAKHPRERLEDWLSDPGTYCPSHMPRIELSEDEVEALAAYLASLR